MMTAKENFICAVMGKEHQWMPLAAMENEDMVSFRPRMNPDNLVTRLVKDGEAPYPYTGNSMLSSWYDLVWDFVPEANGATVHPGNPKVPDISQWEKYISIPDLDMLDWEGCKEKNLAFCGGDRFVQLAVLTGLWERLMSLMDVENAAVALIDEEQQEGVHRFLSRHADMLIDYIDRMTKILPIDSVLIHDDWGHQRGPFFSQNTCREMILPYLKRIVDFCHSKNLLFELHSCGSNATNVPCMIEAGVDLWCGQPELNDFDTYAEQYQGESITFGFYPTDITENDCDEMIRQKTEAWLLKHKNHRVIARVPRNLEKISPVIHNLSLKLYAESK